MDWKQVGINLLVVGVVYAVGYFSSYFLSRNYAKKMKEREKDEKQK